MKYSYSNIFTPSKKMLDKAKRLLAKGSLVALPTETVYGLACNAYSNNAVKKIFKLKGRPKFNPLIIHYYNDQKALDDVIINNNFKKLYKKLCPGPITFILKKKGSSKIQPSANAKLETVAVRFPKHKVIRTILKAINFPLAMPSANISSSVSPVCAQDVFDEFKKKIKFIVDGGQSKIGIESTVIDLTDAPKILRPGIIAPSKVEKILNLKIKKNHNKSIIKSPGMLKRHYSPGLPIKINQKKTDKKSAFIYLGNKFKNKKNFFSLSNNSNLTEAASNLYKTFRLIKKRKFKKIQIAKIPLKGSGVAINDRIKRAASKK